jgi:hypothetical protein
VNQSHNCADSEADLVLHSYLAEQSSKENFSNKGGEGEIGVPYTTMQESPRSESRYDFGYVDSNFPDSADEACLGPVAVNSPRLDMGERCGPCTADCYENCGVWMPSGSEIREVWGELQRDNRRLD